MRRHKTVSCIKMTKAISFKIRAGRPSGPVALLTSIWRRNFKVHLSRKHTPSSSSPTGGCQVGSGRVAGGRTFFISHVTAKQFAFCSGSRSHSPWSVFKAGILDDLGFLLSNVAFSFHHFLLPRTQSWRSARVLVICFRYSS